MKKFKTDLLIIGAGPGGLGAAIYAKRSGLEFIIVEKNMAGGQIINTDLIENYPGFMDNPSGFELAQRLVEHCKKFEIEIKEYCSIEKIEEIDNRQGFKFKCSNSDSEIFCRAIIMATGANPDKLGVKGEEELIGKGVSFCATCDGALYRGKEVAVVGGGDTAVQESLFLCNLVDKVYIIHRRDELRACDMLQCRAKDNPKIEFLWSSIIEEFVGTERLESVIVKNKNDGTTRQLDVAAVFEYVGWQPNSAMVKDMVELDEKGFIKTDNTMKTSKDGIFAIGDVRNTPFRQVITSVADGAIASMYADKYFLEQEHSK